MLRELLDWSEAWAPLIPMVVMIFYNNKNRYMVSIKWYVIFAFIINLTATIIWKRYKLGLTLPGWLDSNTFLYNTHAIVQLICFSIFFILLKQRFMHRIKLVIPFLFLALVLVNFIFFEDYYSHVNLSSRLLATEAAVLLFYCLQYFIYLMIEERNTKFRNQPGVWVVTGLSFYVAVNFFIFLFYIYLSDENKNFAVDIWDLHNIMFIVLCTFLAIQLGKKDE